MQRQPRDAHRHSALTPALQLQIHRKAFLSPACQLKENNSQVSQHRWLVLNHICSMVNNCTQSRSSNNTLPALPKTLGLSAHTADEHRGQVLQAVPTPAQGCLPCSSLHLPGFPQAEIAPGALLGSCVSELSTPPIPFFVGTCKPYSCSSHLYMISSANGCLTSILLKSKEIDFSPLLA